MLLVGDYNPNIRCHNMNCWRSSNTTDIDSTNSCSDDDTDCNMSSSSHDCLHDSDNDDRTIVLRTMRALENTVYKRPRAESMPDIFCGLWRRQIVEWMYVLIKYCKLKHEATAAAVYYLDKAVMHDSPCLVKSPKDYQLCAMTALHLALKVYDSPTMRVVKLSCLVKLGNGEFTEEDIIRKEQDLVQALGWRINPPTADCFLQRYLELLPFLDDDEEECEQDSETSDENDENSRKNDEDNEQLGPIERRRRERLQKLEDIASELIEVAMARDRFLSVPASVIAYAALLSAMELTSMDLGKREKDSHEKKQQHCYYDWSTFFSNMRDIAKMGDILGDFDAESLSVSHHSDGENNRGRVSRAVRRTKVLLDRIVKGATLPPEEEDEAFFDGLVTNATFSGKTGDGNNENGNTGNAAEHTKSSAVKSTSPSSPVSTVSSVA